jgi:mRNA interferase YafQ
MTDLEIIQSNQFKRDVKKIYQTGKNIKPLEQIIALLVKKQPLPHNNKDHKLKGNWVNHRECHIAPDWLLIYRINEPSNILELVRTGSHSELF